MAGKASICKSASFHFEDVKKLQGSVCFSKDRKYYSLRNLIIWISLKLYQSSYSESNAAIIQKDFNNVKLENM